MSILTDQQLLSFAGGVNSNSLTHILQLNNNDKYETNMLLHSHYYDFDQFSSLISTYTNYFSIFSSNIHSINAKFDELQVYIEVLDHKLRFKYNIICLQETWQSENYHDTWDGLVVKLHGGGLLTPIYIYNLYRPPRSSNELLKQFINDMSRILNNIYSTKQKVIFAGDFNINLLEINENHNYSDFFDLLFTNNLLPQITLPTRFSVHNGTLIDNLFTNIQFTANPSKAGILLDKLSDHQPYFMIFNTKRVKEKSPQYVQINNINDTSIANIIHHLTEVDIFIKLDKSPLADVDANYEIIQQEITKAIHDYLPKKTVKFQKYKHKRSKWITQGVIKSIKYRNN